MTDRSRGRGSRRNRNAVADPRAKRRPRAPRRRHSASRPGRLDRWAVVSVWAAAGAFGLALGLTVFAPPPATAPALAGELVGRATVTDGDTLEIRGQRVRLHGIDAPESGQRCEMDGERYRCGQKAAFALADRIGQRTVACERKDIDRYGRIVAVCKAGGEDLNAWMVRSGLALAYREYSRDYVDEEAVARAEGLGLWRGDFVPPWDWRRGARLGEPAANDNEPGNCRIKGNISRSGERIYHVPGDKYYEPTRISPGKGERWFCSEAEARAAGRRRSRQ